MPLYILWPLHLICAIISLLTYFYIVLSRCHTWHNFYHLFISLHSSSPLLPLVPQSWRCNREWEGGRCLPEAAWRTQSHRSWWSQDSQSHPYKGCYWASGLCVPPVKKEKIFLNIKRCTYFTHTFMFRKVFTHPLAVEVVNSLGNGVEHSTGLSLREKLLPEDLIQQLPSLHQLCHQVYVPTLIIHLRPHTRLFSTFANSLKPFCLKKLRQKCYWRLSKWWCWDAVHIASEFQSLQRDPVYFCL